MPSPLPRSHAASQAGFTLIEMLITMVIMMMIFGLGVASYIQFNDRQNIRNSARELQSYLHGAQSRARAGDRPAGCDQLNGYQVESITAGTQIRVSAVCFNNPNPVTVVTDTYDVPSGTNISGTLNMTFGVLHGGVTGFGTVTIVGGDQEYEFLVTRGGEISVGDLVEQ